MCLSDALLCRHNISIFSFFFSGAHGRCLCLGWRCSHKGWNLFKRRKSSAAQISSSFNTSTKHCHVNPRIHYARSRCYITVTFWYYMLCLCLILSATSLCSYSTVWLYSSLSLFKGSNKHFRMFYEETYLYTTSNNLYLCWCMFCL